MGEVERLRSTCTAEVSTAGVSGSNKPEEESCDCNTFGTLGVNNDRNSHCMVHFCLWDAEDMVKEVS